MDEKFDLTKGNAEIEEALREFNPEQKVIKQNGEANPPDVSKLAREAFKEFELKEKIKHNETQVVGIPALEINESLKEFEQKYNVEQQQKRSVKTLEVPKSSKLVQFVMKISGGLIKEERQAEYALLGVAILFFLISGYLFFGAGNTNKPKPFSPADLEKLREIELNSQNKK